MATTVENVYTITEEDIQRAQKFNEQVQPEQLPLLLVNAMMGKPAHVDGVPDELVSDQSPNEPESSIKGLILSKQHIIKIKAYVRQGLTLPLTEPDVKTYLQYDSSFDANKYQEIAPNAFVNLYGKIHNHSARWSGIEARIKQVGTSLNIFGKKFVDTGTDIVSVINEMPLTKRLKKLGQFTEDFSVPFGEDDKEIKLSLLELVEILKKETGVRKDETHALLETLESFRDTMENEIVPGSQIMNDALKKLDLSGERAQLLNRSKELDKEIKQLDTEYKENVRNACLGGLGGPLIWAIVGGIYGDKAEKARKKRNARQNELNDVNQRFAAANKLIDFISRTSSKMQDLSIVITDAVEGVKNLETMWASVDQYIEDAAHQLEEVDESKSLLIFNNRMQSAVSSWREVKDITGELIRLFEEAQKEAEKLTEEAA